MSKALTKMEKELNQVGRDYFIEGMFKASEPEVIDQIIHNYLGLLVTQQGGRKLTFEEHRIALQELGEKVPRALIKLQELEQTKRESEETIARAQREVEEEKQLKYGGFKAMSQIAEQLGMLNKNMVQMVQSQKELTEQILKGQQANDMKFARIMETFVPTSSVNANSIPSLPEAIKKLTNPHSEASTVSQGLNLPTDDETPTLGETPPDSTIH